MLAFIIYASSSIPWMGKGKGAQIERGNVEKRVDLVMTLEYQRVGGAEDKGATFGMLPLASGGHELAMMKGKFYRLHLPSMDQDVSVDQDTLTGSVCSLVTKLGQFGHQCLCGTFFCSLLQSLITWGGEPHLLHMLCCMIIFFLE